MKCPHCHKEFRYTIEDRFRNDPVFAQMVNAMRGYMVNGDTTPTELREAVTLAATLVEAHRTRYSLGSPPSFVPREEPKPV